jgi:hypothetical protein
VDQSPLDWRSRGIPLLLAVGLAVLLFGGWWVGRIGSGVPSSSGYATALEACSVPLSSPSTTPTLPGSWQVVVEVDRPEASVLVIISGRTEVLCVAIRDKAGRFTGTSSSWGQMAAQATPALSYDTGQVLPGHNAPSSLQAVVGRVPAGTTSVVVLLSDGVTGPATLGGGHYLALLNSTAPPERIVAIDASGAEIASLANLHGLVPK